MCNYYKPSGAQLSILRHSGEFYQVSLHPPASDTRRSIPRGALHFLCCSRRIDLIDLNVLLFDALHQSAVTQHTAAH